MTTPRLRYDADEDAASLLYAALERLVSDSRAYDRLVYVRAKVTVQHAVSHVLDLRASRARLHTPARNTRHA